MGKAWIVLRTPILCGIVCSLGVAAGTGPCAAAPTHRHPPPHEAARPATPANSGPAWNASQCGREPAPPAVDTSTVDRYNASVDRVTTYEKSARTYNACVSKAATLQQTAISNDARARIDAIQSISGGVQKRIAGNFTTLTTALRAGAPKLQAPAVR